MRSQNRRQPKTQIIFENDTNNTEGSAAQSKRIARTARLFTHCKQTAQHIEFVGESDSNRYGPGWRSVRGSGRLVMFQDRGRDLIRFAIVQRIVASHDALQLGKFTHHFGQQIGFAEHSRAAAELHICTDCASDLGGQGRDALYAIELAPELCVKDDLLQRG